MGLLTGINVALLVCGPLVFVSKSLSDGGGVPVHGIVHGAAATLVAEVAKLVISDSALVSRLWGASGAAVIFDLLAVLDIISVIVASWMLLLVLAGRKGAPNVTRAGAAVSVALGRAACLCALHYAMPLWSAAASPGFSWRPYWTAIEFNAALVRSVGLCALVCGAVRFDTHTGGSSVGALINAVVDAFAPAGGAQALGLFTAMIYVALPLACRASATALDIAAPVASSPAAFGLVLGSVASGIALNMVARQTRPQLAHSASPSSSPHQAQTSKRRQ